MSAVRIRNQRGVPAELQDDYRFVEICDTDGNIAVLVYADEAGAVKTVTASDPMAARYEQLYGVKFCPILPVKGAK